MLGSLSDLKSSSEICDVVIVGGGPAGLTLAHTLGLAGKSVLLLEAGGERRSRASQDFYRGEIAGLTSDAGLDTDRVRALGGASRIWDGRVLPFDPIDFARRDWVPGSGWPIDGEDLAPHYQNALIAAEAGMPEFSPQEALPHRQPELAPGLDGERIRTMLDRFSKPTNFWRRYRAELTRLPNVKIVKNAPAVHIQLGWEADEVTAIEIAEPDGNRFLVPGRTFVLAMGALETTRLMMVSDDICPDGVGNDHDQLGRHYMSHLSARVGTVSFSGPPGRIALAYDRDRDGIYVRRRLWLTEQAQREFSLLNTGFRTRLPERESGSHGDARLAALLLARELGVDRGESGRGVGERLRLLGTMARHPLRLAAFGADWTKRHTLADRKLPSAVLASPQNSYELEFHAEQAPNPDSRVLLSQERDAHGMVRLSVDWRLGELDVASVVKAHEVLGEELARTGTGRLDIDREELIDRTRRQGFVEGDHIGTTRMSSDPRRGVVDEDCRVHGIDNLYIASASVFPTAGQASPTLTLLALAYRLAEHLASQEADMSLWMRHAS